MLHRLLDEDGGDNENFKDMDVANARLNGILDNWGKNLTVLLSVLACEAINVGAHVVVVRRTPSLKSFGTSNWGRKQ